MQAACPYCTSRMYVPDVYVDRLVKCLRCTNSFVPGGEARTATALATQSTERLPPEPVASEFRGFDTDHDKLLTMCSYARLRGNENRYAFLSAYAVAQRALLRDTWQAAVFEWQHAHGLLQKVHKQAAMPLVAEARCEFIQRASDQLVDFAQQMHREFCRETVNLSAKAQRIRAEKIAAAYQRLISAQNRPLIDPEAVAKVEQLARIWSDRALV